MFKRVYIFILNILNMYLWPKKIGVGFGSSFGFMYNNLKGTYSFLLGTQEAHGRLASFLHVERIFYMRESNCQPLHLVWGTSPL